MNGLTIKSIEIAQSDFLNRIARGAFVEQLGAKLAGLAERVTVVLEGKRFSHYVCSSTLDILCSSGWLDSVALSRKMQELTGVPCTYSNAMQCATWGFMVRQHLIHKPGVRDLIISIVDANPLNMRFWQDNSAWGRTSQRITMVHLEIPMSSPHLDGVAGDIENAIMIGKCNPESMLYDYALEIQRAAVRYDGHTFAIPYFEEKMRKGLKRSLADYAYLPDGYEDYGHLCGADPWMSIAKDYGRHSSCGKRYLASSIASEGYFCFLSASLDTHSHIHIEEQMHA